MEDVDEEVVEMELEIGDSHMNLIHAAIRAQAGLLIVAGAVGIIANLYVVCAAWTSLSANVANRYVLQRALADILFLLSVPFQAGQGFLLTWPFGDAICKLVVGTVHGFAILASALLLAICVDAYKAFGGYSYDARGAAVRVASMASWAVAALISIPFFVLFGTQTLTPTITACTLTMLGSRFVIAAINVGGLIVVFGTIVGSVVLLTFTFPPSSSSRAREVEADAHAVRRLALGLTVVFCVLQLAFALPRLVMLFEVDFSLPFIAALHLTAPLPFLNAAVDPIVYIVLRRSLMSPRTASGQRGIEIMYVNLTPEL